MSPVLISMNPEVLLCSNTCSSGVGGGLAGPAWSTF